MHSSSIALWYASRATGIVCLVLTTTAVLLGLLVSRQGRLPGLPRFGVVHLHRYVSLLAVGFVVVHILTAIVDSYVSISVAAAVIPFVSAYKPFWLGLGAVSIDLMAAVIVTSLIRGRIGRKTWRAVHWLAYAAWPIAVAHSIGSGPDLRSGPLLGLTAGSALAVLALIGWRVAGSLRATPRAELVPTMLATREPPTGRPARYERIETARR
jgi:sulfoxide reductase heme-binding subunit YedZ